MKGVETRDLRQGEGVGEATTEPLSSLSSLANHPHSSEALGRFGHWIATLKREGYCVRIVFVIYIGIPLRIYFFCYTYAGQDICKGSHRLVRNGVGARWVV